MRLLLIPVIVLSLSKMALGHPVIYKDGWVYWGTFTGEMNTQRISYTFHPSASIEASSTWFENLNNYRDYVIGGNYLFKRWLQHDSQGNLYGSLHTGYFKDDFNDGSVHHVSLIADWESRVLYTAGRVKSYIYEDDELYQYNYRFGFAPFVAGMQTLQAWLILQLEYFEENDKNIIPTPMLRFFYNNVLWEMGANTEGGFFFTLMTHY